ncbi:BCCT family transporter [Vibrio metschnikovii]|uniref:BCCT family transporter n=1 Tax=Vibrio metschnikovii TaxID=28172 RepID=UPI001C30660A|nr:BCCT family transporter [Vibrio metschnikovii]
MTFLPQPSHRLIFFAALIAVFFVAFPSISVAKLAQLTQWSIEQFDDQIILLSSLAVVLCVVLCLSPIGKKTLGDGQPEFSFTTWLIMLFTTGMGSGLIFWGVAEPIFHFNHLPSIDYQGDQKDLALALTYFHWGIHAWSLYALAGLMMAWLAYVQKRPMRVSASFIGHQKAGWLAIIDLIAVLAILFGIAGVLANTMALVEQGIRSVSGYQGDLTVLRIGLTVLLGVLFTASSALGLQKGIKQLSRFNVLLMLVLFAVVFVYVDTLAVIQRLLSSLVTYINILPQVSFGALGENKSWSQNWTVIYLVWWIAWTPFVGPFIARISRGRSIRQFLCCTVLIPTLASVLWFSGFAGAIFDSLYLQEVITAVSDDYTKGLFVFFSHLPASNLLAIVALILLLTFVISSADSAIYAAGMLTNDQRLTSKISWSVIVVTLAIALVTINDVDLNKQIAIAGALPFTFVLIAQACFTLLTRGSSSAQAAEPEG